MFTNVEIRSDYSHTRILVIQGYQNDDDTRLPRFQFTAPRTCPMERNIYGRHSVQRLTIEDNTRNQSHEIGMRNESNSEVHGGKLLPINT